MRTALTLSCSCALLLLGSAQAASIFRCTDASGHTTFTRQGCPSQHESVKQTISSPTPGSGKPVPMAQPQQRTRGEGKGTSLTIVGTQDDGCGNRVVGSIRRNAMINRQSPAGMTRADVESTFGKPDRISSRNGYTTYRYKDNQGNTRSIRFDESGCVTR